MSREAPRQTDIDRLEFVFPPFVVNGIVSLASLEPLQLQHEQGLEQLAAIVLEDIVDAMTRRQRLKLAYEREQSLEFGKTPEVRMATRGTVHPANQVGRIDLESRGESEQRVQSDIRACSSRSSSHESGGFPRHPPTLPGTAPATRGILAGGDPNWPVKSCGFMT